MEKSHKLPQFGPTFPAPSEKEVAECREQVLEIHDVELPGNDAKKLVSLTKESKWWAIASTLTITRADVNNEVSKLLTEIAGINYSPVEVSNLAKDLLVVSPERERERVQKEIRAILVPLKPVPREVETEEKLRSLLTGYYGVALSEGQVGQTIVYLTRVLWYEEGLEQALKRCLDDLLLYVHGQKKDERAHTLPLHNEVRQALDWTVSRLTGKEIRPLYVK